MATALKVKVLTAAVNVPLLSAGGKPQMRQAGFDEHGKPIVEPATGIVFLDRGDDLPDNVSDDEVERLKSLDAVGTADEVAQLVRRLTDPAGVEAEEKAAAEERLAQVRGESGPLDVENLGAATVQQLTAWITDEKPKADDVVKAVGENAEVAARVIAAENAATSGDPRKTVVEPLQKLVDDAGAGGQ